MRRPRHDVARCEVDLRVVKTVDPILTVDIFGEHGTHFDEHELGTMLRPREARRLAAIPLSRKSRLENPAQSKSTACWSLGDSSS